MLAAVGMCSKSLTASVQFYSALGVTFPPEAAAPTGPHVEGTTSTGLRLMFDTVELMQKLHGDKWVQATGHATALCFEVATPAEVDAVVARAAAAGGTVLKAPWDAFWGQRYASLEDPDGNQVDVFAALPAKPDDSAPPSAAPP